MHKEENEKRDFLPEFFDQLKGYKVDLYLEEGYGEGIGYSKEDYLRCNDQLQFVSHERTFEQDMVVVLRCPTEKEIQLIPRGAVLISMLHYETRETRNRLLVDRGIHCFSMDGMTNDQGERILVNYRGTSRAGSRIAFQELRKRTENFKKITKDILCVSIIGAGAVAANSARAFEELGDSAFMGGPKGLLLQMLPRSITQKEQFMRTIMNETDILVDASKRPDSSKYVIPNAWIGYLPPYAILLDLAADPYNEQVQPIQVKGIEGIPTGTLDQFVIEPEDPVYQEIPASVSTVNRRLVVSCNAWPGIDAHDCMKVYGQQLIPIIDVLFAKELDDLDINSRNLYERSLVRSSLDYYLEQV
ncbi:MAG: hypothetical protein PHF61_06470 [Bacteroidales bacterium]|nr:hypothetical protein [Bacteroidales bacterium]